MANEIDSLASYIKDSGATTRSTLIARAARNGQDISAHAKPAAVIADNLSNSCQANAEGVTQDKSVIQHHNLSIN